MIVTKLLGVLGILFIIGIVFFMSDDRRSFPMRTVIWGLALQFGLGFIVLNFEPGILFFKWFGDVVTEFLNFSRNGTNFIFGNLGHPDMSGTFGFQFGLIILGTIIFFSAFVSIAYHYGIMQRVVYGIAWIMSKTMGTSGPESLSVSGNVFLGQTEAPLLIRHYLPTATRSEMLAIMVGGFAHIAGGVMAAYIQMGISATILITASLITAPGALMLAKIVMPLKNDVKPISELKSIELPKHKTLLEALSKGASDGFQLAMNIVAMLIAFISIIAVLDYCMGYTSDGLLSIGIDFFPRSLKELLGYFFYPFAWLVDIPTNEIHAYASLVGTKVALNEFIAYTDLSELIRNGLISDRTAKLATFALCGFANFSSIAIQIGGLGAMVPEKKAEIASLGLKAMTIGALANMLAAQIASILI